MCQGSGGEMNTEQCPAMLGHTTGTTAVPMEGAGHPLGFFSPNPFAIQLRNSIKVQPLPLLGALRQPQLCPGVARVAEADWALVPGD